ncbi:4'-phosphopantetheinyl transferase family protein [Georgenia sp. AZ-5]|uniref:4'-phosphopantetheinyl transferase family protein n=1 Tax=Georgenia sp. AZ-5 TaxID=3367526 RepID=UPI0037548F82
MSDDPALGALLSPREQARAERIRGRADRARYVSGHAAARLVLAHVTAADPAALRFDTTCPRCGGDHGKPRLVGEETVRFSLSRSGDRVAVAVAEGADVGVDVERVDPVPPSAGPGLAAAALAPGERAEYERLPPGTRPWALLVWWTRKEAVLKATGDGLAISPARVEVSAPGTPAALRHWSGPGDVPRVALADLIRPRYVAAVAAVGGEPLKVSEHDVDTLLGTVGRPGPRRAARG